MKPMKSVAFDESNVPFPVYAAYKLDGYRAVVAGARVLTNSLKEHRNEFVQSILACGILEGTDGELLVGDPAAHNVYSVSGAVTAYKGEPDFGFYVFDDFGNPDDPFIKRIDVAAKKVAVFKESFPQHAHRVTLLKQVLIHDEAELRAFEEEALRLGYEGVMIRRPDGRYKFGRSTVKEALLLKVKRFSHGEGVIIGFKEQMHNENEAYIDELGRTARSGVSEGMVPTGLLGALQLSHPNYAEPFYVSAGRMTHKEKEWAWNNREFLRGKVSRYTWFPHGTDEAPRHGIYDGLRCNDDLGTDHPLYRDESRK